VNKVKDFKESEEYRTYKNYAREVDYLVGKGIFSPIEGQTRKEEVYHMRKNYYLERAYKETQIQNSIIKFIFILIIIMIIMISVAFLI
jgi:dihydrofolate reductase